MRNVSQISAPLIRDPRKPQKEVIFDKPYLYTRRYLNISDGLRICQGNYFSNLLRTSPSRTPRALAILAQVNIVGVRLWLSMKLMAGRLTPTFFAKASWDKPCSLRSLASSLTTFSTSDSATLSLIERIIADLLKL